MFDRIKKILSVFVAPFFVVSIAAVAVIILAYNMVLIFANNIFFQK